MRLASFIIALLATFMTLPPVWALDAPMSMEEAFRPSIAKDGDGRAVIRWQIADGYYLYRDYLAATTVDGKVIALQTLPGKVKDDPGFGRSEVYYHSASATIDQPPARFILTYQGCQDGGLCYPPTTRNVALASLSLTPPNGVGGSSTMAKVAGFSTPADIARPASAAVSATVSDTVPNAGFAVSDEHAQTAIDRMLADGGLLVLIAGFMGFGLLLAFTPCVFPMYPIVAAMLSRQGETLTAGRGFALSSVYVVGLASAFGLLGMAAAWSGQNLQVALQSRTAVAAIAILFVVLALSNFGLFSLQLPAAITARLAPSMKRGSSLSGAALLGFSSALFIGPCVTAPLAGALLYIARTGDVLIGALALFALGLGKGIPLIVMATASAKALPRAGMWMENVRQVFGFLFLATALWMAAPLLSDSVMLAGWAALALGFGVFAVSAAAASTRSGMAIIMRSAGLASILWGALLLVGISLGAKDPLVPLAPLAGRMGAPLTETVSKADFTGISSAAALASRISGAPANEPTLLYVTADWCVTCRTIERSLLTEPDVGMALRGVQLTTLDVTKLDADKRALMADLQVIGPPTMIFFDPERQETAATRLVGEFSANDLATSAHKAKEAAACSHSEAISCRK